VRVTEYPQRDSNSPYERERLAC